MKKVIKEVGTDPKIVQVTVADERWYVREKADPQTGLPGFEYVPSVTWITGHYPKGVGFYKWLAEHGWDEAEAIKQAAGDKGSKVHFAVEALLAGRKIAMDSKILSKSTDQEEELTLEEYECILSFHDWLKTLPPGWKLLASETVVWNDQHNYAGTIDLVMEIDGERWIIDIKTAKELWPEYELQVSAYKAALQTEGQAHRLAILQLGYRRNKAGFKFTEVEDQFDLFLAAQRIWRKECEGIEPRKRDYPLSIQIEYGNQSEANGEGGDLPEAPAGGEAPGRRGKANRTAPRKAA